jgi:hypothetical protein
MAALPAPREGITLTHFVVLEGRVGGSGTHRGDVGSPLLAQLRPHR